MKYLVTGYSKIEFETLVEASSEEEALEEAANRDISICVHGTSMSDGEPSEEDWTYKDAPDLVETDFVEEHEN